MPIDTNAKANPLLQSHTLPAFDGVSVDDIEPAIAELIEENNAALKKVLLHRSEHTWETLIEPLDLAEDKLEKAWSVVSHLNSVQNSDEIRKAYEASQQKLTEFYSAVGQNHALFEAYESLTRAPYFDTLNIAKKTAVENALRGFRLSGVALSETDKKTFTQHTQALSRLSTQFSNNVLDATQSWFKHILAEEKLAGIPQMSKDAAKQAAQVRDLDGWVFTLDIPSYLAVLTHADDETLRKEVYHAYATRASEGANIANENKIKFDNTQLIEKILVERNKQAKLLGFRNYAQVSIEPKMAESTSQVIDFLNDLAGKSKPQAEREKRTLEDFAKSDFNVNTLNSWDIAYYSEKLKEKKFNVSQEEVRTYFPLPKVKQGLFELAEKLFNITIKKSSNTLTYHPDVTAYTISRDSQPLAEFYFDLYTRDKKRGGAWMAGARSKKNISGQEQTPVAFLVCNFPPPVGDAPSLLTHNDVTTLFHEFGHGLHHMLTKIDVPAVTGINGVAWDAVELPSQFMENFCWQKTVLPSISGHYQTQAPLPDELLNNMIAGKNFQSAMQMVRQIEFSLFDFLLHKQFGDTDFEGVQACLDAVRARVAVNIPPAYNKFQNSFSHIFAGGYAAGYYSYKWAEVLSADAFSMFEEEGVDNPDIGKRFLTSILEQGGAQPAMTLFENFRGRKPTTDALLRHNGIQSANISAV